MTIIESDPPVFRLHVPAWVELTDDRTGTVTIDAEWLQKPAAVATAILKATKSVSFSGSEWKTLWMGGRKQPSLHNALLAEAHREPAPPEMQEWAPAAEHLLRQIDAAIEGTEPDDAGSPVWVEGVCWFEWPVVFDQVVQMGRLTKAVVDRLYRRLDMIHRPRRLWPEAETGRRRQYGLSRQAVADLRRMARGEA